MFPRLSFPRRVRRGRISAAVAAAVVIATPAAIAGLPDAVTSVMGATGGPDAGKAPRAEAGAPAPGTPIRAGLLRLEFGAAGHGVAVAPVAGAARPAPGAVALTAREGSRFVHGGGKPLGGKVLLDGGVRLSKGDRSVVIVKDLAVDLRTHVVTATVGGGRPGARLGVLRDTTTRLLPRATRQDANIAIGGRLVVDGAAGERIDAALGAPVFGGAGTGGATGVDATFEAGADLDVDLARALGLDDELGLEPRPAR